jgi:hypothetical protein
MAEPIDRLSRRLDLLLSLAAANLALTMVMAAKLFSLGG